jgi:hypothetical protein
MITSRGSTGVSDQKLWPSPAKAQIGSPPKKKLLKKSFEARQDLSKRDACFKIFQNIGVYINGGILKVVGL